jgi:hypothetical protein
MTETNAEILAHLNDIVARKDEILFDLQVDKAFEKDRQESIPLCRSAPRTVAWSTCSCCNRQAVVLDSESSLCVEYCAPAAEAARMATTGTRKKHYQNN